MEPLAVELNVLLRAIGTDLRLSPGRVLTVRIAVPPGPNGRGVLSLAGTLLEAQLPKDVEEGEQLRLVVRDVSADRVVLAPADRQPEVAPLQVPLPGGGTLSVVERDGDGGGSSSSRQNRGGSHTVALRYQSPTLGAIDLRLELADDKLHALVGAGAGEALSRASAGADALRDQLAGATHRSVAVTVQPRRDPLDLYA
jgi:hypothetical protein